MEVDSFEVSASTIETTATYHQQTRTARKIVELTSTMKTELVIRLSSSVRSEIRKGQEKQGGVL